ncbi:hypothetical protein SEA_MAGRITTE_80 [Microbacterium phage Magritte]|nr:hypothetical protein SEA_MAGRITTE_80 [Microbacterium phage Magritte]
MTKLTDDFYLVLQPTKHSGVPVNGQRPVSEFKVERIRRGKPFTNKNEVAVRLNLVVDSTIFDSIIPNVEIELGAQDLFVNTKVEVLATEPPAEDED